VFTAVAAVETGYPLAFSIDVQSPFRSNFTVSRNDPTACDGNHYCPRNAGDTTGTFDMWTGFGRSVNTFWVPLEQMVGVARVVDVARRLGIQFRSPADADLAAHPDNWGAFTLGVSATTPLELANACATLAADGTYCEPTPVTKIIDPAGGTMDAANPRCHSVVAPQVARAVVDLARCPVGDQAASGRCGGATAPYVKDIVNRPVAGKTGTTDSEKSATFVAMTTQLAVAGFLTDPDWPDTTAHMKHPPVNRAGSRHPQRRTRRPSGRRVHRTGPEHDVRHHGRHPQPGRLPERRDGHREAEKGRIHRRGLHTGDTVHMPGRHDRHDQPEPIDRERRRGNPHPQQRPDQPCSQPVAACPLMPAGRRCSYTRCGGERGRPG